MVSPARETGPDRAARGQGLSPVLFVCALVLGVMTAHSLPAQTPSHMEWSTLEPELGQQPAHILAADSPLDFWLEDARGNVYHHSYGQWRMYAGPEDSVEYYGRYCAVVDDRPLLCLEVRSDYSTWAWAYRKGNWKLLGPIHDAPVRRLSVAPDGTVYASGDWGYFARWDGQRLARIELPFRKHITTLDVAPDGTVWLGTREEGIWRWDGDHMSHLPVPGAGACDVNGILVHERGFAHVFLSTGLLLEWDGVRFSELNRDLAGTKVRGLRRTGSDRIYMSQYSSSHTYSQELLVLEQGGWETLDIPAPDPVFELRMLDEGHVLAILQGGRIMLGRPASGLYFHDLTSRRRAGGYPDDLTRRTAVLDANRDGAPDLFLLNSGLEAFNQLLLRTEDGPFLDATRGSGLTGTRGATQFAFGDVTGDGRTDALFAASERGKVRLDLHVQGRGGRFTARRLDLAGLPEDESPRGVQLADVDQDGDLDIYLSYYYGGGKNLRGRNVVLENRAWGHFRTMRDTRGLSVPGWHWHALFAHLNGDDHLDAYLVVDWLSDELMLGGEEGFRSAYAEAFGARDTTRVSYVAAVDLQRDADLDLVLNRVDEPLALFRNDGDTGFVNVASEVFPPEILQSRVNEVVAGDVDHDGDEDLLLLLPDGGETMLRLLEWDGGRFSDATEACGLQGLVSRAQHVLLKDLDGDGDLDIYVSRQGANQLLVNRLDDGRSVTLHFGGMGAHADGMHARCWLYRAGHLEEREHLVGYRQVGVSTLSGPAPFVHFGVGDDRLFDVRIVFSDGREWIGRGVEVGDTVHLAGALPLDDILRRGVAVVVNTLRRGEVQSYLFVFALAMILMGAGLVVARRWLRWGPTGLMILLMVNLSVFWLIIMLTLDAESNLRFVAPLVAVLLGVAVPFGLGYSRRYGFGQLHRRRSEQELLSTLLVFGHGEWALSNLGSLKRLGEYAFASGNLGEKQLDQLRERARTFEEMTGPNLDTIVALGRTLEMDSSVVGRLAENRREISAILSRIDRLDGMTAEERHRARVSLGDAVQQVREDLRALKDAVFRQWSCRVDRVIQRTLDSLEDAFREAGVPRPVVEGAPSHVWGLIRPWELADILDNTFRNALAAMRDSEHRQLRVRISEYGSKLQIDVADTGMGIEEREHETIFQPGVSKSGGTGQGLGQARSILARYGGHIFVKESVPGGGTTFTIHLNEGRESLETPTDDRR